MKTRWIPLFLAVLVIVGLCGCNGGASKETSNGNKVLKLAYFSMNNTDESILELAAKTFQKNNPGVAVEITDYSKKGYNIDKYIKTINTQLMAGKGPDIVPIAYLPAIKYIRKNIFADISGYIGKDNEFNDENYFMNVVNACKYKGAIYALPVYFDIRAVIASKDAINEDNIHIDDKTWSLRDFIDLCRKETRDLNGDGLADKYALPKVPIESLVSLFVSTEKYVDYEKLNASFSSGEFEELIGYLKALDIEKLTHPQLSIAENIPYKQSQACVFSGGDIYGYKGLLSMKYRLGGGDRVLYRLPTSTREGGETFGSPLMLAINNKSKVKDYAWGFINLMASKEMQSYYGGAGSNSGFPIYKPAFANQLQEVTRLDWRVRDDDNWIPIRFSKDELKFVQDYVKEIDRFSYSDSRIYEIVIDEIKTLFNKNPDLQAKDIKKVSEEIQQRVNLYLKE